MDDRQRRIEERAHRLWEREGRPEGRAQEHWERAEAEIAAEHDGLERPVDEIDTIRRTLEVPKARQGDTAPADDRDGAMSGLSGFRRD